jgi:hypothetical protein
MKRLVRAALLSVGLWGLASGQAFAQLGFYRPPQINPYPVVSPYVNMANGMNPATTYFGIVRPQMEMNQNMFGLQQQIQGIQENAAFNQQGFNQLGFGNATAQQQLMTTGFTTGHAASFQNFSYYYPTLNRNGMGGMGGMGGTMNTINRQSSFNKINGR